MRKILMGLILFLALAVPAWATNFIVNPGYENGMSSWKDLFGYPSQITAGEKHLGTYSASKAVGSVSGQDYWSQIYQDVPLAAGQGVYGRLYIKTTFSPEATAQAGVMIQYLNSTNKVIGTTLTSPSIGGTQTAWRLVEVTAKTAPTGTVKARLSGFLWALQNDTKSLNVGKAFFDDAALDKVYRAPVLRTALLNTGFENGKNDWTDKYGSVAVLDKTYKFAGIYSAKKTITAVSSQDYWSQLFQEVAVAAGKHVTGSLYIKTNFNVTAQAVAGIQIEFLNSSNVVLQTYSQSITAVNNWVKKTIDVPAAPTGTVKLRFSAFVYAPQGDVPSVNGAAYFDSAALTIL